jgi:hypothetical protein
VSLSLFPQARASSYELLGMRNLIVPGLYLVCSLSMIACGPDWNYEDPQAQWSDDPRSAALIAQDIYETELGPLRQQCVEDAKLADFRPLDPGSLGRLCGTATNAAVACFYQYDIHGPKFAILSSWKDNKSTQVHEFMHYMLQCGAQDVNAADVHHDGDVWLHFDDAAQQMHQMAEPR